MVMAFCTGCREAKSCLPDVLNAVNSPTWGPLRDLGKRITPELKTEDIYSLSLSDFITPVNPREIFDLQENFNNQGNFGQLYLARDKRDGKTVCVKILSMDATDEMILQEVRGHAVATQHAAVCALYGVFMEEGWLTWWPGVSRRAWLVMEYAMVPGFSSTLVGAFMTRKR